MCSRSECGSQWSGVCSIPLLTRMRRPRCSRAGARALRAGVPSWPPTMVAQTSLGGSHAGVQTIAGGSSSGTAQDGSSRSTAQRICSLAAMAASRALEAASTTAASTHFCMCLCDSVARLLRWRCFLRSYASAFSSVEYAGRPRPRFSRRVARASPSALCRRAGRLASSLGAAATVFPACVALMLPETRWWSPPNRPAAGWSESGRIGGINGTPVPSGACEHPLTGVC